MRVNRADKSLRQKGRYTEMDASAREMSKLVKKGSEMQHDESDRLRKKQSTGRRKEDSMQIRYELDDAIIEIEQDAADRKCKDEDEARRVFVNNQSKVSTADGRCCIRPPSLRHGEEEDLRPSPEWKMALHMRSEARLSIRNGRKIESWIASTNKCRSLRNLKSLRSGTSLACDEWSDPTVVRCW